jgi:hypothetical protein
MKQERARNTCQKENGSMRRRTQLTAIPILVGLLAIPLDAQKTTPIHPGKGGSPHVKTEWTIDGAAISIEYGRPFIKGRPEAELMPAGKPWRAGADEATVITTDKPLKFGSQSLAPGSYTINLEPGPTWQLIIGKLSKPGQWGVPYDASLEMWRVPMTVGKTAAPVEQVTFTITDTPAGATLRLEWGTASVSVPFTVG